MYLKVLMEREGLLHLTNMLSLQSTKPHPYHATLMLWHTDHKHMFIPIDAHAFTMNVSTTAPFFANQQTYPPTLLQLC